MSTGIKHFALLLLLIVSSTIGALAQSYEAIQSRIDSIANFGLPKSALAEVEKLDQLARKNKNAPMQVKAVIYRITLQSYIEENALIAIIDTLKHDISKAEFPVKPVLQSLLAETYWKYYEQNRWKFNQRSRLEKPDADFTNWDLQTIITETGNLYKASLSNAAAEQATPITVLDGVLNGAKNTRQLRPTLYDLLVHRAFDFFLTDEPALTKPKMPFALNDERFFSDGKTFAALNITSTDTASIHYTGIKLLQQATLFHLQQEHNDAAIDLDLKRLGFLFRKSNFNNKDTLYVKALQRIAIANTKSELSADALKMLGQYYKDKDSLKTALFWLQKAAAAYPASIGGKNADALIRQINEKALSVNFEMVNMPNAPSLALLGYKNVKAVKVSIYKLSQIQLNDCEYLESDARQHQYSNYKSAFPKDSIFTYLNKIKAVQQEVLNLPDPGDYRHHTTEFKISPLKAGIYMMLVRDAQANDTTLFNLGSFRITQIAYSARKNPDDTYEVRVMDRTNGMPLGGVSIAISSSKYVYNSVTKTNSTVETSVKGISDANGKFKTNEIDVLSNNLGFKLIMKGDTLTESPKYVSGQSDREDDDEPAYRTVLFTDRQIYRPGQTVYFKALRLSTINKTSNIVPQKQLAVDFKDANDKTINTLKLTTNEYGTVAGSFIIPQSLLAGEFRLTTDDGSLNFRVEEYKRPTFKVEFSPVKGNYKPNDSVTVEGKVTAFSGFGLSSASVAYHITRSTQVRFYNLYRVAFGNNYWEPQQEIKTDTIKTNDKGEFKVKFKALPTQSVKFANYSYNISADITDQSGETHSAQANVVVGEHQVNIQAYVPVRILKGDSLKIALAINNLNGQQQKGKIHIEAFALKAPAQVFKNRLWQKPDQHLLDKETYASVFPEYAYDNEDNATAWPVLNSVFDKHITVDDSTRSSVSLKQLALQPAGTYQIKISAQNAEGDTASTIQYVQVFDETLKPSSMSGWLMPLSTQVKPGQNAEFLVGIGAPANVLMEKYKGAKLISSTWLTVGKTVRKITLPVTEADDADTYVQFMMVYHNRFYAQYHKLYILRPDKNLDVHFLTYRNQLQPGQKEEWKIQVSGKENEKMAAEMVAGLYDASLDDIAPGQNWAGSLYIYNREYRYFVWNEYNFITQGNAAPVYYRYNNYGTYNHDYERLNLFGYNYYGGYNNNYQLYMRRLSAQERKTENDQKQNAEYTRNAALVKNGYEVTGKVIGADDKSTLAGVTVNVKGTSISVATNSQGEYRIKVPVNATLRFSFLGYTTKEIVTNKSETINAMLAASANTLNEVVTIGYGTKTRQDATGAVSSMMLKEVNQTAQGRIPGFVSFGGAPGDASGNIMIRGAGTMDKNAVPLYVIDGVIADGANLNPNDIENITILKDASATALYGARAANGVVVITTKKAAAVLASQQPAIRKNFNETAFFYPQLHTNEKGEILIDFTIPEALTRWKFRAFAHTKDLKSGYLESEVVTQKKLSITANMPRFFRESDTVTISARLANLTATALKGEARLQLFNGVNMQPVRLLANGKDSLQSFEIAASSNKAISFKMIIPAGLDAITYRLTAASGNYSDGEENTYPVLPNRMLVTESMPMMVRAGQTKGFTFEKLLNQKSTTLQNKTFTLEYTQNPAWYAVQALPYLMEFPYECSEQIFSRYYANSMASSLVNKMPEIKRVFDRWKAADSKVLLSNLEKNQELKQTLIEETPWLRDAENETEQKKRIALLFDLNKMGSELSLNLDKLLKKQLPDGGFPWFGGDRSDRYITQHIAAGIGQLIHLKIGSDNTDLKNMASRALSYLNNKLEADEYDARIRDKNYRTRDIGSTEIHAWYVNSYFTTDKLSPELQAIHDDYLKRAEKYWKFRNVYEQGLIALTMLRNNKTEAASMIIRSLKETAQQSDDMGMYWAKNMLGYYWYQSPIETQCLLIELFTEAGNNDKAVEEMKIWLLRNKQANNWKTTKATAAGCYALLLKGDNWLATNANTSTIKLNGTELTTLKPDTKAEAGTGYIKTTWTDEQVKPELGKVQIKNTGKTMSWGAVNWQYLEQLDKITPSQTDIHLERKYFIQKQTDAGAVLTAVDATHQPKTGDLLKVVVYLKAGRDFEYVQLKDMRPAGTEPVDALSTYKYQDGLYYYQVTKDVATNFFISNLNKGNYVFEYRLRVAQPGNFSTGITTVQSMYAPEFNAHSEGARLTVKP